MIAFISMLLSYMEFEWDSSADRIGDVENIASLFKAILEHVGQSPSLRSITFIWQCCAQGLLTMETQYFPDLNAQTPVHLALPLHCLLLTSFSGEYPYVEPTPSSDRTVFSITGDSEEVDCGELLRRNPPGFDCDLRRRNFVSGDGSRLNNSWPV